MGGIGAEQKRSRRWWIVGAVLLLCAALFAVYLMSIQSARYGPERRFDAAVWKSQTDDKPVRLGMVRDLMKTHQLVGMSQTQLVQLLGPPLAGDHKFAQHGMVYWLGPEEGGYFSIDSEWLLIDLGYDGRANAAAVKPD